MPSNFSYKITPLALADIDDALGYITNNLKNPKAARDLYFAIMQAIDDVCVFPKGYCDCMEYNIENTNIRKINISNYILIYEVAEELSQVNILRFRYGRMNLVNIPL